MHESLQIYRDIVSLNNAGSISEPQVREFHIDACGIFGFGPQHELERFALIARGGNIGAFLKRRIGNGVGGLHFG